MIKDESRYLRGLIEDKASKDLSEMQSGKPYLAPATVLIPTLQEIGNQLGAFADSCRSDQQRTANHFLKPVVDPKYLDFDPISGEPAFSERGKNEIKALCTIQLNNHNREMLELMTNLQTAWEKAQAFQKKHNLNPATDKAVK